MINFLLFLVIGGVVGWIASKMMGTDAQQGIIMNVIIGVVGAILAGWLISPLVGVPDIRAGLSIGAVLVSLAGALIVVFVWKMVSRRV